MKRIIVLGASGMLGHKVFETLSKNREFDVYGTVTSKNSFAGLLPNIFDLKIFDGVYANKIDTVESIIKSLHPDIVINCIGIIKQNKSSNIRDCIEINALFPHLVSELCEKNNCRFITIATDCVFDGKSGNYHEDDEPTCHDVYGMTKYLGEVSDRTNTLTLRTSIIGHELSSNISLINWFLSQEATVKGYKKAIFSGLTTLEFSRLLINKIIPNDKLFGLHHISARPISKHDLLTIVAEIYQKKIIISADESIEIDRSLDSDKFKISIDYDVPSWNKLIFDMYNDFLGSEFYKHNRDQYAKNNKF
ncbi:MAG: SDR family oxidoreductase [bacterium]